MNECRKLRLGVLGSGKGSNFAAIAQACIYSKIQAEVAIVISDVPNAGILSLAREFKIPGMYIAPGQFKTKLDEKAEQLYISTLKQHGVELVVLAGFMRILKKNFLDAFPMRVINIHPSLLPSFPGLNAWEQALNYGVKVTGCTVHFVDHGVDTGPIIAQETVRVLDDDTPESLHVRIQTKEHEIYPRVIDMIAKGLIRVEGRRVFGAT